MDLDDAITELRKAADRVVNDAAGPGPKFYRVGQESLDALRAALHTPDGGVSGCPQRATNAERSDSEMG